MMTTTKIFTIMHWNARSAVLDKHSLVKTILDSDFDVALISEN